MTDKKIYLDPVSDDQLENLTESVTTLLNHLHAIEAIYTGTFPPAMVNRLIDLENTCNDEMQARGMIEDFDETAEGFAPEEYVGVDPATIDKALKRSFTVFFDAIESIDFDQPLSAADDDDDPAGV